MWGEERDRVVAPVIGETLLDKLAIGDELVDGHQLDGRDPEAEQVVDDGVGGDPEVGPAEVLGDGGWRMVMPRTWAS